MIKYRQRYKYKKKKKNLLVLANLYVKSSMKNTILSLTKNNGEVLKQWSTKALKKGKFKKNTRYNVQLIVYKVNKYVQLKKIRKLNIHLKGSGVGRYNIIRNLKKKKIKVSRIFDKTFLPFNGCRVRKMSRR